MNKRILWYQHQDPNADDVIYLNGERVVTTNEMQDSFSQLRAFANRAIDKPTPWCGNIKGYFFVKGYLKSKDNVGRIMSFLYLTDGKDCVSSCIEDLAIAGLEMSIETEKCLYGKKMKIDKSTAKLILIIFSAILACLYIYFQYIQ